MKSCPFVEPSLSLLAQILCALLLGGCFDKTPVSPAGAVIGPLGNAGGYSGIVAISNGGTGATTASGAIANLGLGTAATQNVGTGPNLVVQLDDAGKLPSLDGSALTTSVMTRTTGYSLGTKDSVVVADSSAGAFTIQLPSAVGIAGKAYTIKKTDASTNPVSVVAAASQTIDGLPSYSLLARYRYVTVTSDGANWSIVGSSGGTPSCTLRTGGDLTTSSATASCLAGETRTGGGCNQNGSAYTYQYYPVGTQDFYCSSGSSLTTVKAYAICCTFN